MKQSQGLINAIDRAKRKLRARANSKYISFYTVRDSMFDNESLTYLYMDDSESGMRYKCYARIYKQDDGSFEFVISEQ